MSAPSDWSFQWPDGTWIHWNPETETWEKEQSGVTPGSGPIPIELPAPISVSRPAEQQGPGPTAIAAPEEVVEPESGELEAAEAGTEGSAEALDYVVPARPRRVDTTVIAETGEDPGSLWPSLIVGAAIGLAAGALVSVFLR